MKKSALLYCFITACLLFWASLFIAQVFKIYSPDKISNFAAQCEFAVHAITLIVIFKIRKKLDASSRKIWAWLIAMTMGLFITDLTFYLAVYLPKEYILSASFITFIFGYIPYIAFMVAAITLLCKILLGNVLNRSLIAKLLPFFVVLNIVIILLFLSSVHYNFHYFSWETMSHVAALTAEFVIFDLALISLIYSESIGFSILLIGTIILITGDFFINYSFMSQTSGLLPPGELFWFLGLIGILFGVLLISKDQDYDISSWCSKTNQIKNRLAFWSFGTSIASFLIFFVIAYCFSMVNKQVCLGLPLFIMGYSIIVVVISIFMGRRFEAPFKKLTANVEALMQDNPSKIDDQFSTEEFAFLQKFIIDAFELKEQKDAAKRRLGEVAAQVAHDICSPAEALAALAKKNEHFTEEERSILREATATIQQIAKETLDKFTPSPL